MASNQKRGDDDDATKQLAEGEATKQCAEEQQATRKPGRQRSRELQTTDHDEQQGRRPRIAIQRHNEASEEEREPSPAQRKAPHQGKSAPGANYVNVHRGGGRGNKKV